MQSTMITRSRYKSARISGKIGLHGNKGLELEMDVCLRLSDKSTPSQEQDNDVKGDISPIDEVETISKTTPRKRLQRVTRLKRKQSMFTPKEGRCIKTGLWTHVGESCSSYSLHGVLPRT